VQRNKVKKIILRFEEWLIDQQSREDLIGDLARVPGMQNIAHKAAGRKSDEHKNWANVVIGIPEPGYIYIFNEAWQEFILAKQAAEDFPD
jgi:hypothetical protein